MPALTERLVREGVDIRDRDLIDGPRLQVILCCSRSHLGRLLRNEIRGLVAPLPRPFKIGNTKQRFWRASAIRAWIDGEQAATEGRAK